MPANRVGPTGPNPRKDQSIQTSTGDGEERRPSLGPFDDIRVLPESLHDLHGTAEGTVYPQYIYSSPKHSLTTGELDGMGAVGYHPSGEGKRKQRNGGVNVGSEEEEDEDDHGVLERVQNAIQDFVKRNRRTVNIGMLVPVIVVYHAYLVFAIIHSLDKALTLLVWTLIIWAGVIYYKVIKPSRLAKRLARQCSCMPARGKSILEIIIAVAAVVLIAGFLIWDTSGSRERLTGLCGMAFFILVLFLGSKNPSKVRWRPVLAGLLVQFIIACLVLRWSYGARKFNDLIQVILTFLHFAQKGSDFVYGFLSTPLNICGMHPVLAFSAIQVVIYFGSIVSLLYYYGVIQFFLKKMAWIMELTIGTTATESLHSCACIFVGLTESLLVLRPYLDKMTASEIHAVMANCFSCISGAVLIIFINFGACPNYLVSSIIMTAPASLALAKLFYPECEESQLRRVEDIELPKGEESGALEAVSNGAVAGIELTLAIIANIIAFLGMLALFDAILLYLGHLIGMEGWSMQLIFGYLLFPVTYLMGITSVPETLKVAELLGIKIALNDFISYQKLGVMVDKGELSPRSAMIATYGLCSFSNFTAIGIVLGVMNAMAPKRKRLIGKLIARGFFTGVVVGFFTASLAGVLIETPVACHPHRGNPNCFDLKKATLVLNMNAPKTPAALGNMSSGALGGGGGSTNASALAGPGKPTALALLSGPPPDTKGGTPLAGPSTDSKGGSASMSKLPSGVGSAALGAMTGGIASNLGPQSLATNAIPNQNDTNGLKPIPVVATAANSNNNNGQRTPAGVPVKSSNPVGEGGGGSGGGGGKNGEAGGSQPLAAGQGAGSTPVSLEAFNSNNSLQAPSPTSISSGGRTPKRKMMLEQ